MSAIVLIDAKIVINSVNMSTFTKQVMLKITAKEEDVTTFGGNGYVARIAGLKDWSLECEFNMDFAAGAVDATLWPIFATVVPITINPTSAANSATNPQYTGNVLVVEHVPMDGKVGVVPSVKVPFKAAGPLTRVIV